jgi:hypothetical protein
MLPFSLVSSLTSAGSGFLITYMKRYRPIIWVSYGIYTLGMGLMTMMDASTPVALQEIYPLIAGFGLGCLFQSPFVAVTAAMPPELLAVSVASLALVRTAGGTIGITVAGAVFNSGVQSRLKKIPEYANMTTSASQTDLRNLVHIQPPALAHQVVAAYGDALQVVWIVLAPIVGIGFLSTLFIKAYSLNRRTIQKERESGNEKEAAVVASLDDQATTELTETDVEKQQVVTEKKE